MAKTNRPKASARRPGKAARKAGRRYTPAVDELVAIGAAIACNCERCFKYHFARAKELGVTCDEMAHAVATGQKVKNSPAAAILELAQRHLRDAVIPSQDPAARDVCSNPALDEPDDTKAPCCSKKS